MKITKILHPTDFSECSKAATRYAHSLAKQYGASVVMMYVVDDVTHNPGGWYVPHISLDELTKDMEQSAQKQIDRCCYETFRDVDKVERKVLRGVPDDVIANYARDNGVDLIVMGTHGKSGMDFVFGSTTEKVIRKADCPVLCVKGKES
ncbi:MAG TPA: universal stress protein [Nitrospirota bacterium]